MDVPVKRGSRVRDHLNLERVLELVREVEVAKKYNASEGLQGDDDQYESASLKRAWNNLKVRARKKKSAFVKDLKKTGGGPPPSRRLSHFDRKVLAEAGDRTEFESNFDSESQFDRAVQERSEAIALRDETDYEEIQEVEPCIAEIRLENCLEQDLVLVEEGQPLSFQLLPIGVDAANKESDPSPRQKDLCQQLTSYSLLSIAKDPAISFYLNPEQGQLQSEDLTDVTPQLSLPPSSPPRSSPPRSIASTSRNRSSRALQSEEELVDPEFGSAGVRIATKKARAPSTLAGRYFEDRSNMEANWQSEQHKVKMEILALEKAAGLIYKQTLKNKSRHEDTAFKMRTRHNQQLFEIERQKMADLAQMDVLVAKFRVRKEHALAVQAEKAAGLEPSALLDSDMTLTNVKY
ncbi:uncharacterized protein LOC131891307 [Tigriopus californicus]|uniref:uncharacterized protein LOC131891307 n=1 Tax=Tigriopus californicus TaxID=6832 RepID=UPI0027DA2BF7|nr:uncharacterized protein LOC131891307 [Tigriopus californicus]